MTDQDLPTTYDELLLATRPSVISGDDEYQRQLKWIDRIMMAEGPTPTCEPRIQMLELLSATVMTWESKVEPMPNVTAREMLVHTMEARELSQAALSKQLDVSPQLISAIIKGGRVISQVMARKLADAFDHPIEFYIDKVRHAA